MKVVKVDIEQLMPYIEVAFEGDEDLIQYFDKEANVKTVEEAIENVKEKIKSRYEDANFMGVEIADEKVGYFVFYKELLISFGLNKEYRRKILLGWFSDLIKENLGQQFNCALYSHNKRAIGFLEKMGMKIQFNNITILQSCQ